MRTIVTRADQRANDGLSVHLYSFGDGCCTLVHTLEEYNSTNLSYGQMTPQDDRRAGIVT